MSVASDSGQHTSLRKHVCPLKGERHYKIRTHRADQCSSFSNLDNASGVTSVDYGPFGPRQAHTSSLSLDSFGMNGLGKWTPLVIHNIFSGAEIYNILLLSCCRIIRQLVFYGFLSSQFSLRRLSKTSGLFLGELKSLCYFIGAHIV